MTVDQLISISQNITVVFVLVVIIYGGYKEWWVFGNLYRTLRSDKDAEIVRLRGERDEWKDLALEGTRLSNEAIDKTDKVVTEVARVAATRARRTRPASERKQTDGS